MYKLECREVGFDCSHTMTGNTEEEVLQRAREHGTKVHNLKESEIQNPQMQDKLRSLIRKTSQNLDSNLNIRSDYYLISLTAVHGSNEESKKE